MFTATLALIGLLSTTTPVSTSTLEVAIVKSNIELGAIRAGLNPERILKIVACESGFQKHALGDKGKAYSYFQFWKGTFEKFKVESGRTWLDYTKPEDHIPLGLWAFRHGKQDHWTCDKMV